MGFFSKISTKPHYESYSWGTHQSLFSTIIYRLVFLMRIFSPLQWGKFIQREKAKLSDKRTLANDKKARSDFHALHSELYLLSIFLLAVGTYYSPLMAEEFFPSLSYWKNVLILTVFILVISYTVLVYVVKLLSPDNIIKSAVVMVSMGVLIGAVAYITQSFSGTWPSSTLIYLTKALFLLLIVESIMWMFYYMLLRILIEKHLSIYNEAEYFIVLPFVLLTQCFLLAIHLNIDMSEVFSLLINITYENGQAESSTKLFIGTLGYTYTVLIIANIINLIPPVPVQRKANVTIIGAGDVVQNRMLPALLEDGLYKPNQISVASDFIDNKFRARLDKLKIKYHQANKTPSSDSDSENIESLDSDEVLKSIINFVKTRASYVLIATPADEHLPYMKALAELNIAYGVEKPIVATQAELDALKLSGDSIMKNGFLLSYYWLEKALPLNYFFTLNSHYREFLDISFANKEKVTASNLAYIRNQLGSIKQVKIRLLEGNDGRPWSLMKDNGGFYYETLIHPITLLHSVIPTEIDKDKLTFSWYLEENIATALEVEQSELGASYVEIKGKMSEIDVDIRSGKFINKGERYIDIGFTNGSVRMNLDTLCCAIEFTDNGQTHLASICVKDKFGGKQVVANNEDATTEASQSPKKHDKYLVQMNLFDLFVKNSGRWQSPQRFDDFPNQLDILRNMTEWLASMDKEAHFYHPKVVANDEYQGLPNS